MFAPYRSLTQLLLHAGEIRGRKKLQKMAFIAQNLGYPVADAFHLHVWGPYSETLAVKVKEMTEWGFAREEILPGPAGNHHYVYTPGPNADRATGEPVPRLAELVACLNAQDSTFLEGVATALFLRTEGKDDQTIAEKLPRLKPDKFTDSARVQAVLTFAGSLETYRM